MSSFCKCKSYSHFFQKKSSVLVYMPYFMISFNDTLLVFNSWALNGKFSIKRKKMYCTENLRKRWCMLSMCGKNFSRQYYGIFCLPTKYSLIFHANYRDNLHEIWKTTFKEKWEKCHQYVVCWICLEVVKVKKYHRIHTCIWYFIP